MPTLSPSSLSVYDDRSRPKGLTASGARRPLTTVIVVLQRRLARPDECPVPQRSRCIKRRQGAADDRVVVSTRNGLIVTVQFAALAAALAIAALTSTQAEWSRPELAIVLLV